MGWVSRFCLSEQKPRTLWEVSNPAGTGGNPWSQCQHRDTQNDPGATCGRTIPKNDKDTTKKLNY